MAWKQFYETELRRMSLTRFLNLRMKMFEHTLRKQTFGKVRNKNY